MTVREATEFLVIREPMLCKWKKDYKQGKLQAFLGNGPKLEVEAKKKAVLVGGNLGDSWSIPAPLWLSQDPRMAGSPRLSGWSQRGAGH